MTEWIDVKDRLPKEDEFRWVNIKIDVREVNYPCKVWENTDGSTSFINAGFGKEHGVTHWKESEEK